MAGITIPTGYEPEQQKIARRNSLAEALYQQSMAGNANPNIRSWTQPIAAVLQAMRAKGLMKKADQEQADLSTRMREDYASRYGALNQAAANGATPQEIVAQYGTDPMLQEAVKPYIQALGARLKQDQELVKDGSYWRQKGDIIPGQPVGNDMGDAVIQDAQGNWIVNPVRATAALAAQGLDIQNPTTSMTDPRAANAQAAQQYMMPKAATPRPPDGMVGDQPAWLVNGIWYDNPEGRE